METNNAGMRPRSGNEFPLSDSLELRQQVGIYRDNQLVDTVDLPDNSQTFASAYNEVMEGTEFQARPLDDDLIAIESKGGVA